MRNASAGLIRDRASRNVRRLTVAAVAGATALTAAFAGIAAGSTHTAKTIKKTTSPKAKPVTVTAPEPSLTPSAATTPPAQAAPTTTQASPQVSPAPQAPVAVTGGS